MLSAEVLLDSISPAGSRLTTMVVTGHRFILAEFNTHRVFSRNSASSRAIPLRKQVDRIYDDPALPVKWASEKPGMQGGDEIDNVEEAKRQWFASCDQAVSNALQLADLGVHKSLCNRLLEPFMWHTIIVSSTEWDGFWRQRCSPLAQPEIHALADAMKEAYDASEPTPLAYKEWHMPLILPEDHEWAESRDIPSRSVHLLKMLSVARCARVSYLTHDGVRDPAKDIDLYQKLVEADPPHASPLEHVATPTSERVTDMARGTPFTHDWGQAPGNFRGWRQLRHEVLDF